MVWAALAMICGKNAHADGLPAVRTVCCVGTSITDGGTSRAADADRAGERVNYGGGYASGWLPHLLNNRVQSAPRKNAWATDRDHGYSGITVHGLVVGRNESEGWIPEGLIPVADACATDADIYVLEGGTNDLGLPATKVISRIEAYWEYFRSRGKEVIALNLPPYGSGGGVAARDRVNEVNAALPGLAQAMGVTLIDIHSLVSLDPNGLATTESIWDIAHPTAAYAHRIARAIATVIEPRTRVNPEPRIPVLGSASWLTPNPYPSQSTRPAGWVIVGCDAKWASVTDADGTTWQRLTMNNADYGSCWLYGTTATGFKEGDTVRMCARIRHAAEGFDCRNIRIACLFYGPSVVITETLGSGSPGTGVMDPVTGFFVSDEITVPAGTTEVRWEIFHFANSATIDLREIGVFKTKDAALVTLGGLAAEYDGFSKPATVTTEPPGLDVTLTYDGSLNIPIEVGKYRVDAVIRDANYSGIVTGTLVIGKGKQTIDFAQLPDHPVDGGPLSLIATTNSALPIRFELVSGPAAIDGSVLTPLASGVVTIRAIQEGNGAWSPAAPIERKLAITAASYAYASWSKVAFGTETSGDDGPGDDADGDGLTNRAEWIAETNPLDPTDRLSVRSLSFSKSRGFVMDWQTRAGLEYRVMSSDGPGEWAEVPESLRIGDGQLAEFVDKQLTLPGRYYQVVCRGRQAINFPALPAHPVDGGLLTLAAVASSGLPVSYEWVSGPGRIEGDSLMPTGEGLVTVRAKQGGNGAWQMAPPVEQTFVISAAAVYEAWARGVFGSDFEVAGGPDQDADGDGQLNRAEWAAGTNPTDSRDRLQISGMRRSADGAMVLSWQTHAGVRYRLVYSNDLLGWHELSGSRRTGDGQIAEASDTDPPLSWLIYRVEVVLF